MASTTNLETYIATYKNYFFPRMNLVDHHQMLGTYIYYTYFLADVMSWLSFGSRVVGQNPLQMTVELNG